MTYPRQTENEIQDARVFRAIVITFCCLLAVIVVCLFPPTKLTQIHLDHIPGESGKAGVDIMRRYEFIAAVPLRTIELTGGATLGLDWARLALEIAGIISIGVVSALLWRRKV
jgi:hypothetical protein